MENRIILVDENDNEIGSEEKLKAHEEGKLHRAFSIFIFNSDGKLLLQRRAKSKYHSGGLWSNATCGHQIFGEELIVAASKRLLDEMDLECNLKEIFKFHYNTKFDNGLIENEIDYVFVGKSDKNPKLNPCEAEDRKWISLSELSEDMGKNPEKYT